MAGELNHAINSLKEGGVATLLELKNNLERLAGRACSSQRLMKLIRGKDAIKLDSEILWEARSILAALPVHVLVKVLNSIAVKISDNEHGMLRNNV